MYHKFRENEKEYDMSIFSLGFHLSVINIVLCSIFKNVDENGCVDLLLWTNWLLYFLMLSAVTSPIFFFLLKTSSNHETLNKYCTIYKITIFILSAVVGLGLADAYEKEEPCGSLRSYALVAIILIFIMWMIISLINGIYIILMTWVFCRNR